MSFGLSDPKRRRTLTRLVVLTLAAVAEDLRAQAAPVLRVGLVPVLSPRALIALYQPFAAYFEQRLKRPVTLETATDFRAFYQQLAQGTYDLALAPAHLTRLAQKELGWQPLATYTDVNRALVIMNRSRPVRSVEALRGQRLAVFDPLALNVLVALQWLRTQGLEAGRDYTLVETPGHASVAYAVAQGDSLLGVTVQAALRLIPLDLVNQIAIFATMPRVPSLVWGMHPRLAGQAEALRQVMLGFADSPEGLEFFRNSPYSGIRGIQPHELQAVDAYLPALAEGLRDRR